MKKGSEKGKISILYWLEIMVLLSALWFIMSGIFELKFIMFGLISCALISCLCVKTLYIDGIKSGRTYFILHFNYLKMLGYFFWLMWQMIKSAVYVGNTALFRKERLNPQIVWFRADYDNPVARALLANSITFTPGTITIDITDDGTYSVHALTDDLGEGILDGSMQAKVAWAMGETIEFTPLAAHETGGADITKPAEKLARRRFKTRRKDK